MSWNMAGAKLFEHLEPEPEPAAGRYVAAFRRAWEQSICPWLATPDKDQPDIILLQECIGFEDCSSSPSIRWQSGSLILSEIFAGYECFFFPAVTSHTHPHPGKWLRYSEAGADENFIPAHVDIQQGYGICVRKGISPRQLWVPHLNPKDATTDSDQAGPDWVSCFEPISITTGLYLGNRDTEPRKVILGRVKLDDQGESRYLNYLNVHLDTLSGEREGNPQLNRRAGASRLRQIALILENIVSAYQETTQYRMPIDGGQDGGDIWILGGDFNMAPDSAEVRLIQDSGFLDVIPDKRIQDADPTSLLHGQAGSKWSLNNPGRPPIVLDYIFCGLEGQGFTRGALDAGGSKRPFKPLFEDPTFETDHAVLYAKLRL